MTYSTLVKSTRITKHSAKHYLTAKGNILIISKLPAGSKELRTSNKHLVILSETLIY
jgi:hypothetical protein